MSELTGSCDAEWAAAILMRLLAAPLHWPIRDKPVVAAAAV
jgi:hypothetical protein